MAGTATPIFPQTVKNWVAQLTATNSATPWTPNTTGGTTNTTGRVVLVTGGTNGSKVESINIASSDTSARDIYLFVTIASVDYVLTRLSIPANAGNSSATVVSVDVLRNLEIPSLAFDSNGNRYLYVASGTTLSIGAQATLTASKTIDIFAQGGDY